MQAKPGKIANHLERKYFKVITRSNMGTLDNHFPQDRWLAALPIFKLKIKFMPHHQNAIAQTVIAFIHANKTNLELIIMGDNH